MRILELKRNDVLRIDGDGASVKLCEITPAKIIVKSIANNRYYNLLEVSSCWWRRPGFSIHTYLRNKRNNIIVKDGISITDLIKHNHIIQDEASALSCFINDKIYNTARTNLGSYNFSVNKLIVLNKAQDVGLKTPEYRICTESSSFSNDKQTITKPIDNGIYHTLNNRRFYTYTENTPIHLNNVDIFPSIIMEKIEKKYEIRSFYIDGHFFSMAIFSQANKQTEVDFRKYDLIKPNRLELFQLPNHVEAKLRQLFESLNLNTGSVDLIVNKDDDYVFLEINPVGQYDMVSSPCNYELDYVIANYLTYGAVGSNNS
jgi:ATP-GRASP peptide maturase of grasp-with-spasm system